MSTLAEISDNITQLLREDADELGQRIPLPLLFQAYVP